MSRDETTPSGSSDSPAKYSILAPVRRSPKRRGSSRAASISSSGMGGPETLLCGTVEGFYNQPWSHEQRLDLFSKLRIYGMNSYLYAPKDDHKHRANWKERYNQEEMRELAALIEACKYDPTRPPLWLAISRGSRLFFWFSLSLSRAQNLIFFYGISPGLDMSYSSGRDLDLL